MAGESALNRSRAILNGRFRPEADIQPLQNYSVVMRFTRPIDCTAGKGGLACTISASASHRQSNLFLATSRYLVLVSPARSI